MSRTNTTKIAFLLALVAACGDGKTRSQADASAEPLMTYYEHVKPLLDAKCTGCHVDGGIAPFALTRYEDAQTHGGVALLAVEEGIMPPWPPADDCNDYVSNRSLDDAQKQILSRWVESGMLEGDPADEGEPLEVERSMLTRIDLELEMLEVYTPQIEPDDYRCFVVEWPAEYDSDIFVTGFNAVPGNAKNVHHVIAYLAEPGDLGMYQALDAGDEGPGYTCFGGTRGPAQTWIGSWAPGDLGSDLPQGTGLRIEPGSTIILQVHYNTLTEEPGEDRTKIQLKLDEQVDEIGRIQPWTNPVWVSGGMSIPAGDADVSHSWSFAPSVINDGDAITIYGTGFHMHNLGKRGLVRLDRADGSRECLLQIDRWDFHWQGDYGFREPVTINPGDQLYLECHWDNSAANQSIVDGEQQVPQNVNWGEGTGDEMCLTGFYWTSAQ